MTSETVTVTVEMVTELRKQVLKANGQPRANATPDQIAQLAEWEKIHPPAVKQPPTDKKPTDQKPTQADKRQFDIARMTELHHRVMKSNGSGYIDPAGDAELIKEYEGIQEDLRSE